MEIKAQSVTITLYKPGESPEEVPYFEFAENIIVGGFWPMEHVAGLLNCRAELIDVLASGPDYAMFSIFDCQGYLNPAVMEVFFAITGVKSSVDPEEDELRGPIMLIKKKSCGNGCESTSGHS